jgi:N-acetylmuramoyl-L-alanine amidase
MDGRPGLPTNTRSDAPGPQPLLESPRGLFAGLFVRIARRLLARRTQANAADDEHRHNWVAQLAAIRVSAPVASDEPSQEIESEQDIAELATPWTEGDGRNLAEQIAELRQPADAAATATQSGIGPQLGAVPNILSSASADVAPAAISVAESAAGGDAIQLPTPEAASAAVTSSTVERPWLAVRIGLAALSIVAGVAMKPTIDARLTFDWRLAQKEAANEPADLRHQKLAARLLLAHQPEPPRQKRKNRTRFIIGLEQPVEFQAFALTNPNRVFVELPEVKLQLPPHPGERATGLVKSFRGGLSAPGKVRVVIDVAGPVIVDKAAIEVGDGKSARLVLEIVPAESVAHARLANARGVLRQASRADPSLQPPMPQPAVSPQQRPRIAFKPVIVIDPGHGGDDTGAQRDGAMEKTVVLAFSLTLRENLDATGRYKVLMTRENDAFVSLQARREFAERSGASMFISVHAYGAGPRAKGATITSLHDASKEAAVAADVLPEKQLDATKAVGGDVGAIREILADLVQLEMARTGDRIDVFVKSLIEHMREASDVSARDIGALPNHPDTEASFHGLKSARTPSALIQLGNIANEEDAERLQSSAWRDKVSSSIVTAIDSYFSHQLVRSPM